MRVEELVKRVDLWRRKNNGRIPFNFIFKFGGGGITIGFINMQTNKECVEFWYDSFLKELSIFNLDLYLENILDKSKEEL